MKDKRIRELLRRLCELRGVNLDDEALDFVVELLIHTVTFTLLQTKLERLKDELERRIRAAITSKLCSRN